MKVGFIGLGHLGRAMAKRLMEEGEELIVWNRTREKALGLNAQIAKNPAELISKVQVVFINVFDSDAVRSVMTGSNGLIKGNCKGKIVIDTTTNHFEMVMDFHKIMKEHGASYLESPVLGSIIPASQGALTILVSGKKTAYEKTLPLLKKIGRTIFFLGKPSAATKMKLINNLVLGVFMTGIGEAVSLAEAAGITKEQVLDILAAGPGNSMVLNAKREKLLKEDFSPHFSSALIYKDLDYLQDFARKLKKPLLTGGLIKELYAMTFRKKLDGLDFSAIYKVFKEI
jgi:3-hydroxyisobutyrate dehydrogenase